MTPGISGIWSYGAVADFSCTRGFVLSNSNLSVENIGPINRQCTSSGEWSGVPPYCHYVDCGQTVTIPENGNVTYGNETTFASEAVVACSEGYILNGSDTLTCTSNGTWSPQPPSCSAISINKIYNIL